MTFRGIENVVKAIEGKIKNELKCFNEEEFEAPPTDEEEFFLSKSNKINLNAEEIEELEGPTKQEEIYYIL